MPYPVTAGTSSLAGTFIPELWSVPWLVKFYEASIVANIANTDYEGQIKNQGDTVHIRQYPDIDILDYHIDQDLSIQKPTKPVVDLSIDKGKYFAFLVDDVEKHQADSDLMAKFSDTAGEQMKESIDTSILGDIFNDIAATNQGQTAGVKSSSYDIGVAGTPLAITKANVLEVIVDCGSVLTEAKVPPTERWLAIPTWMGGLISKSDLKDASLSGDKTSIMRSGAIGMINNMTIYVSNNVASVTDGGYTAWYAMAGHPAGFTFASQFTNMETLRSEKSFGNTVRGLNVYGYKVTKGDCLALLYCRKG